MYTWKDNLDYLAGAHVRGSDGKEYRCLAPNGPDVPAAVGYVGAIDPTTDTNGYWTVDAVPVITPFVGATAEGVGQKGLVPAPNAGQQNMFLQGNGQWSSAPTYSAGTGLTLSGNEFSLATSGVEAGSYGPATSISPAAGTAFSVPYVTVDAMGRVTGIVSQNVTLPSGADTAQTATQANADSLNQNIASTYIKGLDVVDSNIVLTRGNGDTQTVSLGTTNSPFTGASAGAAGTTGLVPAPAQGYQDRYLRGDGSWVELSLDGVTLANASTTNAGIVQLYDGTDSSSVVLAPTANAVRTTYNLANTANTNASNALSIANQANSTASSVSANYMPLTGGTFTGGVFETAVSMSGSQINLTAGSVFKKTITGATTLSITGSGPAATFSLILTNGGAYTVTWPASVKWAFGSAPTLTASGVDVITFLTGDGGTTWYGVVSTQAAA